MFDQLPGTNSGNGSGYNPLYPFGFGLSYTTFSTSGLAVNGPNGAGNVTARFTVANTGSKEGVDVVPVYVQRPVNTGGILTPTNGTLVGFARVDLAAGAVQDRVGAVPDVGARADPRGHRRHGPGRRCSPAPTASVLDPLTNPSNGVSFTVS